MTLKGTVLTRGIVNDGRNYCSDLILGPQIVSNTVGLLNNATNHPPRESLLPFLTPQSARRSLQHALRRTRALHARAAAAAWDSPDSTLWSFKAQTD
jgi:hypothetical protein